MKKHSKFFVDDELDEDGNELRDAILRELGVEDGAKSLKENKVNLPRHLRDFEELEETHLEIRSKDEKIGHNESNNEDFSKKFRIAADISGNEHSPKMWSLRKEEARLEDELKRIRRKLTMPINNDESPSSRDALLLKSELKILKELLVQQNLLLNEVKDRILSGPKEDRPVDSGEGK